MVRFDLNLVIFGIQIFVTKNIMLVVFWYPEVSDQKMMSLVSQVSSHVLGPLRLVTILFWYVWWCHL